MSGVDFMSHLKEISSAQQQDSNNNISKANENSTKRTYRYTKVSVQKLKI